MRNNFFYILIICAFTEILTKNEEKKPSGKEPVKHTREFYEEEAKKDIEKLLQSIKIRSFSVDGKDDDTEPLDVSRNSKIMERIDEVLKTQKAKRSKSKQKTQRSNDEHYADNFNSADTQNFPLNLRNTVRSSSNLDDSKYKDEVDKNVLSQLLKTLANLKNRSVKSRISEGHNVNPALRNGVNHVNIKPEVYPLFTNDKHGSREIALNQDTLRISDQYYAYDEDSLTKLMNKVDYTKPQDETVIRTAIPGSENFDIKGLLNQLQMNRDEVIPTRKESEDNVRLQDFMNTIYKQSKNNFSPGNRLDNFHTHLVDLNPKIDSKDRDNSHTIFDRNDVVDKVKPSSNDRLNEFMKFFDTGKSLRTSYKALSYDNRPQPQFLGSSRQDDYRGRQRRSTNTQAGYTQDPDTCKTYNENLSKLWSNLSKLTNITEQPNDRALHNIAMMIQAYLVHQNAKQPLATHKEKHAKPKDKISEIMLKIRKLLVEEGSSAEKITKIINKYLKPGYTEVDGEECECVCEDVNKEYLATSVDLLYKNYLANGLADCQTEDDFARTKKQSLRDKRGKRGKGTTNTGHTALSLVTDDFKPDFQTILFGDQLYNDFHKGKVPTSNYRRVFKPSWKRRSRPAYRSGNQNESEKLQTRSKSSSKYASKKHKKKSLKSDQSECDKYATRKLIVSLRPVIERFMGKIECKVDNTLRSVSFGIDSKNPYYLYASKYYSEEDSRGHKKTNSRSQTKDSGRKNNKSHKRTHIKRHDTLVENARDDYVRDDEDSAWDRKYSFDQKDKKYMNSATPPVARDTDDRESATNKINQHGNSDYLTIYNEYFQSPPLYDDYYGIYKTHQVTDSNGFQSLKNPLDSLNDKKTSKELAPSGVKQKSEDNDEYGTYYEELFAGAGEPNVLNDDQQTQSSTLETPFIDLTRLRSDNQLIVEKSKTHAKNFESITEFLKKARDTSLQTPEFAVPFALDTNKGYVELTHLIKYPKILVYRPQFLVKNTMPYDDFLKTINNINMTNDDVRLMKIVRHLPDNSVQVLFETEDFEAPFEIRNLDDNRRNSSPAPVVNDQFESRRAVSTGSENTNVDLTDEGSEDSLPIYRNDARRIDLDALVKSGISSSKVDERVSPDFNLESDKLRTNKKQSPNMYFEYDQDTNVTSNYKSNSSESSSRSSILPNVLSYLFPNKESGKDEGSSVGSAIGSQIGSGMHLGLGTDLNLTNKLNPVHQSQWGSFFKKLFSSHSKPHSTMNSQSHMNPHVDSLGSISVFNSQNSQSGSMSTSNFGSHSYSNSSNQEVENNFSSLTQSTFLQWWRKWKNTVKEKMKKIIGKMASFADKIDHLVKL